MELNILHTGDCLEVMRTFEDESIECVLTSPPYNIGRMHSNQDQH